MEIFDFRLPIFDFFNPQISQINTDFFCENLRNLRIKTISISFPPNADCSKIEHK